jgi:hypothetical protein
LVNLSRELSAGIAVDTAGHVDVADAESRRKRLAAWQ